MTPRCRVAVLAVLGGLGACSSARPEAASLVAVVDRFHRASNDERPARADDLAALVCRDADVCSAKAVCLEAVTPTATALRLKHDAEALVSDLEAGKTTPDDPAVKALPAKLDRASHLLEEGHAAMPACDQKILVLRGRYGL